MVTQKRLFLVGGSGLLALNWALLYHQTWDVFLGLHNRKISPSFASTVQVSQSTTEYLIALLSEISPNIVVNAAAATNIEFCEQFPKIAYKTNVVFAERLAWACNHLNIPFVHMSTDHLFSGLSSFATEETPPAPVNVYGQTKADAESRVLSICPKALVIRTNFYGWGTSYRCSFTDGIIQQLMAGNVYSAFSDVYFTPILVSDLIAAIHHLFGLGANGTFHVVGEQRLSKYDFGLLLAEAFDLPLSLLRPISISDLPALVQRPKDMSLSNLKAARRLNRSFGSVDEGFFRLRCQFDLGYHKELQQL